MKEDSAAKSVLLKDVGLFQGLASNELAALKTCLHEKSFQKSDILFFAGKSCERVFIVRSGRVKVFRTASSGREQILEILEPGDTCACNPGAMTWSCSSSAQASTDCSVWFLSRDDYIKLVKTNSKVTQSLNRLFAERLSCFSSLIEEVSLNDARKRLIKFLLDMYDEHIPKGDGHQGSIPIPFTREEIAQRIGSARETVARYLHQLKRSKLIDIKPRQIIICNKPGLEKLLG